MDKPEYVLDRVAQWASLTSFVDRGGPPLRLGLVSGRRRHGKSFLLRALASAYGGLYVTAVQEEGRLAAQRRMSAAVARHAGLPEDAVDLRDWESILATALEVVNRGRTPLLVIDEFPYLLAHSPELPSLLQHLYDNSQAGQAPGGRLILCGSAMSVMRELLSGTKPLRGRAVLDMRLGPFDFCQAAELWGVTDPNLAFRLHAVLGGAPGYRQLVRDEPPTSVHDFEAWVVDNLFDIDFGLFTRNETEYLLREDPRITNHIPYYEVLSAVAQGHGTPSKIGTAIGRERTSLGRIIDVLESAGYLRRNHDLLSKRNSTVTVNDQIIRFNQLITVPYLDLLERRQGRQVWQACAPTFSAQILGPHFEDLCRDWVREFGESELGFTPGIVGTGTISDPVGRTRHELDVLVLAPGQKPTTDRMRIALLGEAKASISPRDQKDLNRLDDIRRTLSSLGHDTTHTALALFSQHGFTNALHTTAATRSDVHLIDLPRLYAVNIREGRTSRFGLGS